MSTQLIHENTEYQAFIRSKLQLPGGHGFDPVFLPFTLFSFQASLTDWAVRQGRAAIYADCGLGKSLMELTFAENVVRKTNRPFLILTPLAVAPQIVREGEKFGIDTVRSRDGKFPSGARVIVSNYEQLHKFDPHDFAGTAGDEAGIMKNFDGVTKAQVTEFMRVQPYRLLSTATPAPNDYAELGTQSEALGELGYQDMLTRFFKKTPTGGHAWGRLKYAMRPHAEEAFWRWVCSWSRSIRKPSDLGFDDGAFVLPPLTSREHVVKSTVPQPGRLFDVPAFTLAEQRDERRRTIQDRCEKVAELVAHDRPAVCWCHLNPEGDLLEKLIPGAVQVSGSDSDDEKEEKLAAFATGQILKLVTKPALAGWGLNWQHCAHQTFFPSHSFEEMYQCYRRSWRFGQLNEVHIDVVTTEGEVGVLANQQRKATSAERMYDRLVNNMNNYLHINRDNPFTKQEVVPSWLS